MSKLNDPGCTSSALNTGLPSCILMPQTIVGGILIPRTMSLSSSDVATSAACITKLQSLVLNPITTRIFPIGTFSEVTPKDEEPVYNTTNYAVKQFVREGKVIWQFGISNGGLQYQKQLRGFNHTKAYAFLFYDAAGILYGCDDGNGGMKGFALDDFYAYPWKAADGSKPTQFLTEIAFAKTSELNDDVVFLKIDVDIDGAVKGLIDVELILVSQASDKVVVKAQTKFAKVNLYDQYSTAMAAAGAWSITKAGVAVTPTGVATVPASKSFEITLTTPSGLHVVSLETPAALDALNIGGPPDNGYESDTIEVTFS